MCSFNIFIDVLTCVSLLSELSPLYEEGFVLYRLNYALDELVGGDIAKPFPKPNFRAIVDYATVLRNESLELFNGPQI